MNFKVIWIDLLPLYNLVRGISFDAKWIFWLTN